MFENAELGHRIDKANFEAESAQVRADLLAAQRELAAADLAVVVIVTGFGGAGKSDTVNLLLEWLDARGIRTHAMQEPKAEDRRRPTMWQSWQELPPRGQTAISFGAWYARPLLDHVFGKITRPELDQTLDRIIEFEEMLDREGVLVVKFWLHLSQEGQKHRITQLEADPRHRWRSFKRDWKLFKVYKEYRCVAGHVLRRTGGSTRPWTIVEATDRRYCHLTVAKSLLDALQRRLELYRSAPPAPKPEPFHLTPPAINVINVLDMTLRLEPAEYKKRLARAQGKLGRLTRRLRKKGRSLILVFEGPDAAGKGGAIRRLTVAMDARDYRVVSIAAPTDEEKARPYLWRFWRQLPPAGRVTIYDRSWYGRVLVERVEGFAQPEQWSRAFGEINAFEEQLLDSGVILIKFWLAITPDEQLRRFEARQSVPYKQYKLTPEDWRNRDRWESYEAAACEMIEKTGNQMAPWILVEGDDKEWARIKVIETVVRRLKAQL
ncbi:polyphosphate:AMP phosphotransferase [Tundrisphaera sp. TA3]|uniref:polyphosphate:AMP phosphotransferase n=1 Tax=Tundrisphaera sp. TA3 TaxID=3435775 RepID=UPI003EB85F47